MTAQIPLVGLMDLDSSNETIKQGYHKYARNIQFKNGRTENVKGTRIINYTLPAGTNECIGSYFDAAKQRVIWFNWNSNSNHGIYQMVNETITPITVCAGTDYLNFTKYPIHSVNILYGDETLGDILYFIDSLKRPTKININRAIASGYGTMERSFLDVAKEPPILPPTVAYSNDVTTTVNNLKSTLFQFAYTWTYDDKEESTLSFFSAMPVPDEYLDPNLPVTTNAKIAVTLQTGKTNVKKIKLYARHNIEGVYSDLYLIETFDKAQLSISNNSTYSYDFKNNITGASADIKFSTLLYDSVPREANTQELVNGDVVVYGAVKEGYNNGIIVSLSYVADSITNPDGFLDVTQAYSFWSWYTFALVYFDDKMRTSGVVPETRMNVYTGAYPPSGFYIPRITTSISHRPPVWATSYQWVRTKNNTKSKFIQWISETTFKDDKYAYIGVQNLYTKQPDDKTKSVITYDFTPGDRIRFITVGTTGSIIGNDYAVEDLVNSPEINSIPRTGYYLKIKLPTTSGSFDFGVSGFGNYLFEVYTPAEIVPANLNTFFEFGEVYQIGNPGLSTRYHKGGTQDQLPDLSQPAKSVLTKGDVYVKIRQVNPSTGVQYAVDSGDAWTSHLLVGAHINSNTIGNETYLVQGQPFTEISNAGPDNWIIKTQGDPYTFRFKGAVKINAPVSVTYRMYLAYYTGAPSGPPLPAVTEVDIIPNHGLVNGDNEITFDTSILIPANARVYLITDNSASQSLHYYTSFFTLTTSTSFATKVFDPNFSDTFLSAVNSNGRPFVIDESLVETYKPDLIRFSEAYQSGTNINKTNRFFDLNYVTCDRSKGDVQRLKVRGDALRAYQTRGVLPFGIYKQVLSNADGSGNLIQSERLLNRIKYYDGDFGIGNQPCSLASSSTADYFTDPIRGYQIRLAGDGMTPISEIYKSQYYLPPVVSNYLKGYTTDSGSASKIIGVYDFLHEDFLTVFQKCKSGSTVKYPGDTLGFNEQRNGYFSFFDFIPESIVCAENTLVMWKDGKLYLQDSETRNYFFGSYFNSEITAVMNLQPNVKKEFISIGYHSNEVWSCPEIVTAIGQQSNLIEDDFVANEGMITAAFLRDANSIGGISEGDFLKGVWQEVKLHNESQILTYLTGLYINFLLSQKTF